MCPMKKPPASPFERINGAVALTAAARRSGIPRRQLLRLLKRGEAPFVQVGGQICIPTSALRELTRRTRPKPTQDRSRS